MMIVGSIRLEQSDRIRIPRVLSTLGGASYAIYLVHFSAITLLAATLTRLPGVPMDDLVLAAVAAVSIALGVAFHRFIDHPLQRALTLRLKPALIGAKRLDPTRPLPPIREQRTEPIGRGALSR